MSPVWGTSPGAERVCSGRRVRVIGYFNVVVIVLSTQGLIETLTFM